LGPSSAASGMAGNEDMEVDSDIVGGKGSSLDSSEPGVITQEMLQDIERRRGQC
jgi:hypothetical protein